jgi:predicted membrane-bound spermidine synthase
MINPTSNASRERGMLPALFFVALATVMFEVLLTRIFSLTMWFHFAFMAISIAMFGLTVGALMVYLWPHRWPEATLRRSMGGCALWLAVSMVVVIFLHVSLYLPSPSVDMLPVILTFIMVGVPFVFSGLFVCLALTRFPSMIGRLYGADLAGAALGCLAVIFALRWLDGVGAVLACAALAALPAAFLLQDKSKAVALLVALAFGGTSIWTGLYLARNELAAFEIQNIKGAAQADIDYERWNSFSRIAVLKASRSGAVAWNLSTEFKGTTDIESRWLNIDSIAGTQLVAFDGDPEKVDFLRWDLPNFVHHLRPGGRVAIVGPGGGRDVLTAKLFGQKRVLAVELNGDIMRAVNGRFGDFTGHLDRDPGVSFVNDEARSYLARNKDRFDIVELTYIDTFAATAAGAYVLSENPLYTVEGWKVFLDRLDDNGLLAVSRGASTELARLVSLGRAALLRTGAAQPERHMVLVTNRHRTAKSVHLMGLLLVRKTPFGDAELAQIRALAKRMNFEIELQPGAAKTNLLLALATGGADEALASGPVDYSAPTDDRPFFFHMARPSAWLLMRGGESSPVSGALVVLTSLLITVVALTLACIALPLVFARTRLVRSDAALLIYFGAIGTGFMLIEVASLQRLIVFLGHPVYGLSVILFVLLLAGGLGSYASARIADHRLQTAGTQVLAALAAVLAATGLVTGPLIASFSDAETPMRIAVSGALLAVMGVPMGMAFPIGMRIAVASREALAPWLWGINGATSVLASVLAVVIAMASGISSAFWTGVASYAVALAAFAAVARNGQRVR